MTRYYTAVGITLSVAYTAGLFVFLSGRLSTLQELPLNAVGDFLAGAFGPVALLWLVLGYFQQGIELKQNTQALELQAEELRNSVQQQRELVEVSRQQFQAELEALQFERARAEQAYKPRFGLAGFGGSHRGDGYHEFSVTIVNVGAACTDAKLTFDVAMERISHKSMHHWKNDEKIRLEFVFENQAIRNCELRISYTDGAGRLGECRLPIEADLSKQYPTLSWGTGATSAQAFV